MLYQQAVMSCSFLKLVINLLMARGLERAEEMYRALIAFTSLCSKKYSTSLATAFPQRDRAGYCAFVEVYIL